MHFEFVTSFDYVQVEVVCLSHHIKHYKKIQIYFMHKVLHILLDFHIILVYFLLVECLKYSCILIRIKKMFVFPNEKQNTTLNKQKFFVGVVTVLK